METVSYTIIEDGNTPTKQADLDRLTSKRIAKVRTQLFGDKSEVCALLPFDGIFPIIKPIHSNGFINSTRISYLFDELTDSIKEEIYKAEKFKYFENLFVKYLKKQKISPDKFKQYQPKHKQLIIDEWILSDRIPDGLLILETV